MNLIKTLVWLQFIACLSLMLNHFLRGLVWEPLMILCLVSAGLVMVVKEA